MPTGYSKVKFCSKYYGRFQFHFHIKGAISWKLQSSAWRPSQFNIILCYIELCWKSFVLYSKHTNPFILDICLEPKSLIAFPVLKNSTNLSEFVTMTQLMLWCTRGQIAPSTAILPQLVLIRLLLHWGLIKALERWEYQDSVITSWRIHRINCCAVISTQSYYRLAR